MAFLVRFISVFFVFFIVKLIAGYQLDYGYTAPGDYYGMFYKQTF